VVATDVGGMQEQMVDGVTGSLVPPGDPEALAEALVAIARDPDARAQMGAAGRARVRQRFDIARMAADYRRVCLGIT
jgi:glycosyltransferase involved in cell wall biosynthesis